MSIASFDVSDETQFGTLGDFLRAPENAAADKVAAVVLAIARAAVRIGGRLRRGGVNGRTGQRNVHGEEVTQMDRFAHDEVTSALANVPDVALLFSEEAVDAIPGADTNGRLIVAFDPLDGSSGVPSNAGVGTIFSIVARPQDGPCRADETLPPGTAQIAAGYFLYGAATVMVLSLGEDVHLFVFDPDAGQFVHERRLVMPARSVTYSCNEAKANSFPLAVRAYLAHLREQNRKASIRYAGSLVADFHRVLIEGGIFMYPPTADQADGKLRLLYEANPMAFIAEWAGGIATDGAQPILNRVPKSPHARTPLYVGSARNVQELLGFLRGRP